MLDPNAPAPAPEGGAPGGEAVAAPVAPAPAAPAPQDSLAGLDDKPAYYEGLPGVLRKTQAAPDAPAVPAEGAPAAAAAAAASAVGSGSPGSESAASAAEAPLRIGDLEFASAQAAEHHIRTVRGRASAADARLQESRLRTLELEREIAILKSQGPKPASDPEPPTSPSKDRSKAPVSLGQRRRVADQIRAAFGDEAADTYLEDKEQEAITSAVAAVKDELTKTFEERLQPLNNITAMQANRYKASQVISTLRTYRNQDGSEAYPELTDGNEAVVAQIGDLWQKMGFPSELLLTQRGLHSAIATYRDAKARAALAMVRPATRPHPVAAAPANPIPTTADAAPGRTTRDPGRASLLDDITQAPLHRDEFFGFRVAPARR